MDSKDLEILERLQRNGRLSNQEIAEEVDLSVSPVWRRIKDMESRGVIRGYVALVDPEHVGLSLMAYAHVSLDNHREETVTAFDELIAVTPHVLECCAMSGEYDYLLKVRVRDMNSYEDFIRGQLLRLGGVRSINTSFVMNQRKFTTALPLDSV